MYPTAVRQRALALVLESHVSLTQAARDVGCNRRTLNKWLKKYPPPNKRLPEPSNTPTFIPVNIVDPPSASIEVVLPNGITIRLTDASPRYIAELLHAIAPC